MTHIVVQLSDNTNGYNRFWQKCTEGALACLQCRCNCKFAAHSDMLCNDHQVVGFAFSFLDSVLIS